MWASTTFRIAYNCWFLSSVNFFIKSGHVARITELPKPHLKEGFLHKIFVDDLLSYRHKLYSIISINPLNSKLNPICHLLALLGAHLILHVSRIRFKRQVKSHLPSANIIRRSPYSPR